MITGIITFFFRTKLGNAIGLALVIAACWYGFSRYYMHEGALACQRQKASEIAAANEKLIDDERKRDSTSSTVAAETREKVEEAKKIISDSSNKTKDEISDEYRKPNNAPAVVIGSCAYPLRSGVQKRIDAAVSQANAATR